MNDVKHVPSNNLGATISSPMRGSINTYDNTQFLHPQNMKARGISKVLTGRLPQVADGSRLWLVVASEQELGLVLP